MRLYDATRHVVSIQQVDGDVVIGTAEPTQYLLVHNDDSSGFNIETANRGPCTVARYAAVLFGAGTTPLTSIRFSVCGPVYVTTLFR